MQPFRRRQPGYGVLLLGYQVLSVFGIRQIPPITLGLVGLQVAIFLRLFQLPWYKASDVCISAYTVWYRKEYWRLLYAALEHGDDWHLYYNMISFIVKGKALEKHFGAFKFLFLTAMFTILTSVTLVGLCVFASDYDQSYVSQCAVGFSGVIFALKVLTSYYYPNYSHRIMGIPVLMPAKYVVWVELILIQLLVPNASFMGHLAGILVGLAYVKGPLGPVLDGIYNLLKYILSGPSIPSYRFPPHAEATGFQPETRRTTYSEYVPPGFDEDEQLRMATEASLRESSHFYHSSSPYPDLNEIRNRRVDRFHL